MRKLPHLSLQHDNPFAMTSGVLCGRHTFSQGQNLEMQLVAEIGSTIKQHNTKNNNKNNNGSQKLADEGKHEYQPVLFHDTKLFLCH